MIRHIRHLAMFTALAVGSVGAQAQVELPGSLLGQLAWSPNALNALNVGNITITALGGSETATTGAPGNYSSVSVSLGSTGAQWLPTSETQYQLHSWQSYGGFRIDAQPVAGVTGGGNVTVTDLDVNFATGQIFANVASTSAGTNVREAMWEFDTSLVQVQNDTDPQQWAGSAYFHDIMVTIPVLSMTQAGHNLIKSGLALEFLGDISHQAAISNYGSLTLMGGVYGPADLSVGVVPEPGTWAMMGLGLVGLAGLSRARSRQACAKSA